MNNDWQDLVYKENNGFSFARSALILIRGTFLVLLVSGGFAILLFTRLFERPVWGMHRPWTPHITQFVCRMAFVIMQIRFIVRGEPMREKGAVVANHGSWLDIFTLNARKRVYFISKSEVADWPGIGWLARATGTVFIRRNVRDANVQKQVLQSRLLLGHKLLFFPEGTSTDTIRIVRFKSTLFAAFFTPELREILSVQPVTVIYRAPAGKDPRFYGWWGNMEMAPHLLMILGTWHQGSVEIVYHPPVRVAGFADRKSLAKYCEGAVRSVFPNDFSPVT